jgi:acyl-CoA thioester hydrolase
VKLGRSSVTYEIALATADDAPLAATGSFTHVFVDSATRRPTPIEGRMRDALERLIRA